MLSFSLFLSACGTPDGVTVNIEMSQQVKVNESFDLIVSITNEADEAQKLTSIDIGNDYLDGILLESSTPSYSESWDFDVMGFMSYDYNMEIPAGETLQIIYTMKGIAEGDYSGSLDVCINTESDCLYNDIRTIVEAE